MKQALFILTAVGIGLFSAQTALSQSAPIVVLEYPTFAGETVDGVNSDHPFIENANHSVKHKVAEAETLSHIITDRFVPNFPVCCARLCHNGWYPKRTAVGQQPSKS